MEATVAGKYNGNLSKQDRLSTPMSDREVTAGSCATQTPVRFVCVTLGGPREQAISDQFQALNVSFGHKRRALVLVVSSCRALTVSSRQSLFPRPHRKIASQASYHWK